MTSNRRHSGGKRPRLWKLRVLKVRLRFAWRTREWPWNVPWQVVYIGTKRPPKHVFEHARKLSEERGWKDIRP